MVDLYTGKYGIALKQFKQWEIFNLPDVIFIDSQTKNLKASIFLNKILNFVTTMIPIK